MSDVSRSSISSFAADVSSKTGQGHPAQEKSLLDDRVLEVEEVAQFFKKSVRNICELAEAKILPGFKVGKVWRFRESRIRGFIEAQEWSANTPANVACERNRRAPSRIQK